jgi:hypothetical protein
LQERIKIPEDKMVYYENLAEMYVGDDVSPDFYGWVFPKCDHVAVGTGTVINKPAIKKYQTAIRNRAKDKIAGIADFIPSLLFSLPLTKLADRAVGGAKANYVCARGAMSGSGVLLRVSCWFP